MQTSIFTYFSNNRSHSDSWLWPTYMIISDKEDICLTRIANARNVSMDGPLSWVGRWHVCQPRHGADGVASIFLLLLYKERHELFITSVWPIPVLYVGCCCYWCFMLLVCVGGGAMCKRTHVYVAAYMPQHLHGGQRTSCSRFSPSITWVPGIKLRPSSVTVSSFIGLNHFRHPVS